MSSIPILSVLEFLATAGQRYFVEARGRWVFRGHDDIEYKLIPSVGRATHRSKSRLGYERSLFDIFCREACAHLPSTPSDEWEWLSIAQHHGLPAYFTERDRSFQI